MQNILNDIQRALNIEDSIEQRNTHKEILVKIEKNDLLFTNKIFHQFLFESFKMFQNDNYYDLCVDLFKQTHSFVDLNTYSDIINDLCLNEKYTGFGRELRNKLTKRKSSDPNVKRKKVSFNTNVEIKYYDPVVFQTSLDTERIVKNKAQIKNNSFEDIDWYMPEKIENIIVPELKSDERVIQHKRECENINFANTEMHSKCVPSDCTNKDEKVKNEAIEFPIVNLGLQNVYKKLDFVKIKENKGLDLAVLLDDPELLKTLQ